MTQAEEIAYVQGYRAGELAGHTDRDAERDERSNPYRDQALRDAWVKGFDNGIMNYLDSKRYY